VDAFSLRVEQVTCAEKSHEIKAIFRLLASLSLHGATVAIDAQIPAAGADYGLALKTNQKSAFHAVAAHFNQPEQLSQAQRPSAQLRNVRTLAWTL
jgi:predicted transposase YbfD/YdcC